MSETTGYGTVGGVPITKEMIEAWADEAERGYPLDQLTPVPLFRLVDRPEAFVVTRPASTTGLTEIVRLTDRQRLALVNAIEVAEGAAAGRPSEQDLATDELPGLHQLLAA